MGGSIGVQRHFYDNSMSDLEYYSIDGLGKGTSEENSASKEVSFLKSTNNRGYVNPLSLEAPYLNRYPFNDYRFVKKLGKGKFSLVYKATAIKDEKKRFAVKEVKIHEMKKEQFEDFRYELNILSQLSHPSILRLHSVYDTSGPQAKFFLVLEYLKGGELINALIENRQYTEEDVMFYASQIISGVQYLHSRGVIHGNLIPENIILLNQRFEDRRTNHIKIVGFDHAQVPPHSRNPVKFPIDPQFRSPEFHQSTPTTESDVWAFGVLLYLLFSGTLPFPDSHVELLHPITSLTGSAWDKISVAAKELVCKLLHPEPRSRITSLDATNNPWILTAQGLSVKLTPPPVCIEDSPMPPIAEDPVHGRKRIIGTSTEEISKIPRLTLNQNLSLLEDFQRKRYFYLENYKGNPISPDDFKNEDGTNSNEPDNSKNPNRFALYRFVSRDFGNDPTSPVPNSLKREKSIPIDENKED